MGIHRVISQDKKPRYRYRAAVDGFPPLAELVGPSRWSERDFNNRAKIYRRFDGRNDPIQVELKKDD